MATIELDIIKQRSEKLMPAEKLELIKHLTASLSSEERQQLESDLRNVVDHDRSAGELSS